MPKNLILCTLCLLLAANNSIYAQNFLWARSGGSAEPTQGSDDETIVDMATDRNGNVYILSQVKKLGLHAAGQLLTGFGLNDIMLASFRPNGTFRWAKIIGGAGSIDEGFGLGTDDKDGVYFSGAVYKFNNCPAYIDTDAVSPKNYQHFILVKYDTAGKFQWYQHPESPTLSTASSSYNVAMDVDNSGNVYWLMGLSSGTYGGGVLTVSTPGVYVLKYNSSGSFSYMKPDMDVDWPGASGMYMAIDDANGRFYLSGSKWQGILTMGSDTIYGHITSTSINTSMYIGSFKLDGSFLWSRQNTSGNGGFGSRAVIDGSGDIYLVGGAHATSPTTPPTPPTVFNGYTVTQGGGNGTSFIVKMDKNGNNIWARDAEVTAASGAGAVALRNNEVIIAGTFSRLLAWPGYSTQYNKPANDGYDIFITRFHVQNGAVLGMDRIASNSGYNELPTRMTSDGKGNVYIGGEFEELMYVTPLDTIHNTPGGQTDWFLIKYGDMWPASVGSGTVSDLVKVYPNPAAEKLTINGATRGTIISIYSTVGQQVYTGIINQNKETINTSYLPAGNYLLQLTTTEGGRRNLKFIKQ